MEKIYTMMIKYIKTKMETVALWEVFRESGDGGSRISVARSRNHSGVVNRKRVFVSKGAGILPLPGEHMLVCCIRWFNDCFRAFILCGESPFLIYDKRMEELLCTTKFLRI